MLFTCVVLHEYGHALAARRYGIETVDIILTPIGGIARLKSIPQKPAHELVIAIAGPLVNLVIIILATIFLVFVLDETDLSAFSENFSLDSIKGLVFYLLLINGMLFSFNLIPAFPMDGGRVLRSLLSFRLNKLRATAIATIIGRIIAVAFVIISLIFSNFSLGIIGVFVYLMAQQEHANVKQQYRIENSLVKDFMRKEFHFFYMDDPVLKVLDAFNKTAEKSFLVYNHAHQLEGVLHEMFIRQIRFQNPEENIAHWVSPQFEYITEDMTALRILELMQKNGYSILPVIHEGQVTGVVDRYDLMRFLSIRNPK
jgi:Zn-dependent protease